jgi:NAD-dependent histone deacetylase SIR2
MVREMSHLTQNAKPTPFHHMLATLAEEGRLMRLYSQNVDNIDTSMPPLKTTVPLNSKGPWPKTIQLHGGLEKMVCSKCGHLSDFDGKLFEGPEPPACQECEAMDVARVAGGLRSHGVGRLRPRMLLYNEYNVDEEAIGKVSSADIKSRPDAVIVVGTSLKIPGVRRLVKEMCQVTRGRRGGFTAWINLDPEPTGVDFKDCWDMVVRGECDEVARHVGLPHWDDKYCGEFLVVEGDEKVKALLQVEVKSKPLSAIKTQGILTPSDSPRQQSPTPASGLLKLKQKPLSFASSQPTLTKDGKVKKKPGRKPLPTKPTKLTNTITNAFSTTKVSKISEKVTGSSQPVFPGFASSPMRPVSPCDNRTNSDSKFYNNGDQTPKSSNVAVVVPYNRHETISPKGRVPSGMEDLIS